MHLILLIISIQFFFKNISADLGNWALIIVLDTYCLHKKYLFYYCNPISHYESSCLTQFFTMSIASNPVSHTLTQCPTVGPSVKLWLKLDDKQTCTWF